MELIHSENIRLSSRIEFVLVGKSLVPSTWSDRLRFRKMSRAKGLKALRSSSNGAGDQHSRIMHPALSHVRFWIEA